jgi:hypothetical protein
MEMASSPEVGDVVVVPEVRASHLVYVVHAEGGSDQIAYETRAEAAEHATAYARHQQVSAWYGDGSELGFVPLGCFRDRTGAREPPAMTEREPSSVGAKP